MSKPAGKGKGKDSKKKDGNPENGGELTAEEKAKLFMLTCQSLQVQLGNLPMIIFVHGLQTHPYVNDYIPQLSVRRKPVKPLPQNVNTRAESSRYLVTSRRNKSKRLRSLRT